MKEIPFARWLRATIDGDPRWISSLGPHRLTSYPEMLEMAARVVPTELWWETVGVIRRLFPGVGPDSFCRDFGDAPSLALDVIFERPPAELELLQVRTRSLVVADWEQNIEIRNAIETVTSKHSIKP